MSFILALIFAPAAAVLGIVLCLWVLWESTKAGFRALFGIKPPTP